MSNTSNINSRFATKRLLLIPLVSVLSLLIPAFVLAHPSPNTLIFLDVSPGKVGAELQLPLPELELAFGHGITKNPSAVFEQYGAQLKEYIKAHIHPYVNAAQPWNVEVTGMRMNKASPIDNGPLYWEVIIYLSLTPQPGEDTRHFKFDYDVILHEVINHVAFVSIRNDWETGRAGAQPAELGVISRDMKDNLIHPFNIALGNGNWYTGAKSMFLLGMEHIKEGTDHLLFLLVLLLPAMLLTTARQWGSFGGIRYSVKRLITIVTAFTIGHSITLLIGALGWLRLPAQPVEILIGVSILVSAIHAIKPLFPGKEAWVAAGFGLIHGLAFASVLYDLHLGAGPMAVSILSFNIGIEIMQLLVIVLIVPWLILLSQTSFYKVIRIAGASAAGIAALAWIAERTWGQPNFITQAIQQLSSYSLWLIAVLAVFASVAFMVNKRVFPRIQ